MRQRFSNLDEVTSLGTFKDVLKWQRSKQKKVVDYEVPQCEKRKLRFCKVIVPSSRLHGLATRLF